MFTTSHIPKEFSTFNRGFFQDDFMLRPVIVGTTTRGAEFLPRDAGSEGGGTVLTFAGLAISFHR
jgi:hypothetical protein